MELQRDEGDVDGDRGQHGLHRLVRADGHILRPPEQEGHTVCEGGGRESHHSSENGRTVIYNFSFGFMHLVPRVFGKKNNSRPCVLTVATVKISK